MQKGKTLYDTENDTLWIEYKKGKEYSYEEYAPGFIVEFGKNNEVIGIEVQKYSRLFTVKTSSLGTKPNYENKNLYKFKEFSSNITDFYFAA